MSNKTERQNYRLDPRCMQCFGKTYEKLHDKFNTTNAQRTEFEAFLRKTIAATTDEQAPEIQRVLNNEFCRIMRIKDPFVEEKSMSNQAALQLYDEYFPKVKEAENGYDLALRLAIAGNIMDYGANNNFDLHHTIERVLNAELAIDHSAKLKKAVQSANRILYLGDNAGEVVFDKLFIETQIKGKVWFAVKEKPILNDVTEKEARAVGMHKAASLISNGYDAPSTVLEHCSPAFWEIYRSADLIISKGQGNYEGLMFENDPRIFFLLMAKCDVIAEMLNVEKGSFVVYRPRHESNHTE